MKSNRSDTIEDNSLWNSFIAGSPEAYARLYNLYADKMFLYGCSLTTDQESVKDAIMDIFVDIHDKRKTLKHVNNVRIYLFISLKNRLIDKIRKQGRVELTDELHILRSDYSVEELFINSEEETELKRKIQRLLQTLSVRQREVIHFRYIEELSYEQIAEIMDMNYQSVRNLFSRALTKMREKTGSFIS